MKIFQSRFLKRLTPDVSTLWVLLKKNFLLWEIAFRGWALSSVWPAVYGLSTVLQKFCAPSGMSAVILSPRILSRARITSLLKFSRRNKSTGASTGDMWATIKSDRFRVLSSSQTWIYVRCSNTAVCAFCDATARLREDGMRASAGEPRRGRALKNWWLGTGPSAAAETSTAVAAICRPSSFSISWAFLRIMFNARAGEGNPPRLPQYSQTHLVGTLLDFEPCLDWLRTQPPWTSLRHCMQYSWAIRNTRRVSPYTMLAEELRKTCYLISLWNERSLIRRRREERLCFWCRLHLYIPHNWDVFVVLEQNWAEALSAASKD